MFLHGHFIAQYYRGSGITMILMHVFSYACLHAHDTVKIDLSERVCIFKEVGGRGVGGAVRPRGGEVEP